MVKVLTLQRDWNGCYNKKKIKIKNKKVKVL